MISRPASVVHPQKYAYRPPRRAVGRQDWPSLRRRRPRSFDVRRRQREAALDAVRRLVQETEPDGWLRLFVDFGDPMERLLQALSGRGTPPLAVERILATFPRRTTSQEAPDQRRLAEPLSRRELEILALLGARDSNKEIAARLFISPGTVKRHTVSIYRKLDVDGRRQAVARATELGLLAQ
jgi:LuxR family maltose regulon positive regulatory protein